MPVTLLTIQIQIPTIHLPLNNLKNKGDNMIQFGIDISKWQGNFDFSSAKKEGVSFAILKGGGGDDGLYKDNKFETFYSDAKKLNLPVGVYWFSKALTVNDAVSEAEYFYKNVLQNKQFELPIFIDVEHEDMLKLGKKNLTDIIKKWCNYLEQKNYWVGIYSTVYAFSAYMNDNDLQNYTHWVAQWANKCTYPNKDVLGLWQFGGDTNLIRSNKISGVTCDQNYMYFDFSKLIKEKGLNGFSSPTSVPPQNIPPTSVTKKSTQELVKEVIEGKWGVGQERKNRLTSAGYDYNTIQSEVNKLFSDKQTPPITNKTVKGGDLVKISPDAVIFGSNNKFASFVYKSLLYVRELNGNRAVISTLPEGPVTGAVDIKYLSKYNP